MSDTITTSESFFAVVRRGDYLKATGPEYAVTTSGLARWPRVERFTRITHATPSVLTVRNRHQSRIREWLHARAEDWFLWPFADVKAWLLHE